MPTKSATPRRQPKQSKLSFSPATQNPNATTPNRKKSAAHSTGNILNFFKKIEVEEQLFLSGSSTIAPPELESPASPISKKEDDEDIYGIDDSSGCVRETLSKVNDNPPKRRKLSHGAGEATKRCDSVAQASEHAQTETPERDQPRPTKKPIRPRGPFLADSDSEDEDNAATHRTLTKRETSMETIQPPISADEPHVPVPPAPNLPIDDGDPGPLDRPDIQRDESCDDQFRDLEDMEGLFGDDGEFDEGEEFRERRFMEEQARLEAESAGEPIVQSCPICDADLGGSTSEQATVHVNACLDGNPQPLQVPAPAPATAPSILADTVDVPQMSKRFAKAAVPRAGQANPIGLEDSSNRQTSAFSKLMSGHAEDYAWASAAAAEHASRGKQAYERTCPFYKIMPGFFICVDAFRYGAIKGCNAYFLSHFHSDHYIGLTANWSHGPIYCSKVTGSLIKNQLRTASKYIKEIEFEETIEVPGTEGVTVTMIPANHCPGSSLFLFEKKIGKGPSPKTQRILHCGDFRACPAHIAHPLLKPDTVDAISAKNKQQKIDVCYLDTTYLNPKYSFPPQNDVIRACAEFCKSISGDPGAADEAFAGVKREKGITTVNSFFTREDKDATTADGGRPNTGAKSDENKNRLLVICGTYSIGKERICKAIAQALNTKIFASAQKIKIVSQLGDPELTALMTSDPYEAQVHMQMLMEIRAETLQDYLDSYKPHFTRIVGLRPSGWNHRAPTASAAAAIKNGMAAPGTLPTTSILHSEAWRPRFTARDLVAQRGSTREAMCFGVPYSEHSSFRELALFLMTLRIDKVVPTVNVGSEVSRKRMKTWTDRWLTERRKGGLVTVLDENDDEKKKKKPSLWDGKDGKGGGVYW